MEKKLDLEHFYEIKNNNGYEPDYDKIRNSEINEMLTFLTYKKSMPCKLFYPIFNYYGIRLNSKMSNELILMGQYLYNINIDYSEINSKEVKFNKVKCEAAKEEIAYYLKKNNNELLKIRKI